MRSYPALSRTAILDVWLAGTLDLLAMAALAVRAHSVVGCHPAWTGSGEAAVGFRDGSLVVKRLDCASQLVAGTLESGQPLFKDCKAGLVGLQRMARSRQSDEFCLSRQAVSYPAPSMARPLSSRSLEDAVHGGPAVDAPAIGGALFQDLAVPGCPAVAPAGGVHWPGGFSFLVAGLFWPVSRTGWLQAVIAALMSAARGRPQRVAAEGGRLPLASPKLTRKILNNKP